MLVEGMTVCVEVLLLAYYMIGLFSAPTCKRVTAFALYGLFGGGLLVLSILPVSPLVRIAYSVTGTTLLGMAVYARKPTQAWGASLMCFVLAIISDILGSNLLQIFGLEQSLQMITGSIRTLYIVVAKLLHLVGIQIVVALMRKNKAHIDIPQILPLISCQLIGILICYRIFLITGNNNTTYLILEMFGMLYINIVVCIYAEWFKRLYEERLEQGAEQQSFQFRLAYYEKVLDDQENTRALWHDIAKHLGAMEAMAAGARQMEMQECMRQTQAAVAQIHKVVDVGNLTLNAIFEYGVQRAQQLGVHLDLDIWVAESLSVSATDLYIIVGNTIDNALEACAPLEDAAARTVSIRMRQKNQMLYYEICNPCAAIQRKEHKPIHGYGLKNVKSCVERYHGTLNSSKTDNVFQIKICLNLKKELPL